MFPLSIAIYFELVALLAALFFVNKLKATIYIWLIPFLIFIVSAELYGRYLRVILKQPNAWLFNIVVPVEVIFYSVFTCLNLKYNAFRRSTAVAAIVFSIFAVVNLFFIQGTYFFNTHTHKFGTILLATFCCLYFYELITDSSREALFKLPSFWLITGVFIFNVGELLYTLLADYLIELWSEKTRDLFASINQKLTWVLYFCIFIAILCIKKKPEKA
jgi:hypothetical protein